MSESDSLNIPNYGVRQEDSWILQSPSQRIMREGDQPPEFSAKLARLHHTDPQRSRLHHSVCARLEFIEQLKYTLQVETADPDPLRYQHENLISYLSLTCLDIVAGRNPKFIEFPKWLSDKTSMDVAEWPQSLRAGILSIEGETARRTEIAEAISSIIEDLYTDDYRDEFGIRRNIHRLITESLPIWLREWLAETFFIVRGGTTNLVFSRDRESTWLNFPLERKLKRIADHLYDSRNRFTHSTSMLPSLERPGMISVPIQGTKYRFEEVYKGDDFDAGVDFSVGIRNGLPQSEVVRLITVAELRSWASIEDSEELIDMFLRRSHYRQAAYSFLNEMRFNKQLVSEWAHALILDRQTEYSRVISVKLSSRYASDFFEIDSSKPAYVAIRFDRSEEYLDLISELNSELDALAREYTQLKKSGFHKSSRMIFRSLQDLINSQNVKQLVMHMQAFTQTLEQALEVPFY